MALSLRRQQQIATVLDQMAGIAYKAADNCGTGDGGFQPGNDCAAGDGSGVSSNSESARVLFEVAPNPEDAELSSRWNSLDSRDKVEISKTVAKEILPQVMKAVGVDATIKEQLGGYLDDTNPAFAAIINDKTSTKDMIEAAKLTGFVLQQHSMMVVGNKSFEGADAVGLITVKLPKEMTEGDIHGVYMKLRAMDSGAIQGHTTIDNEMMLVDFTGDSNKLAGRIDTALGGAYNIHVDKGYSSFISNQEYGYASDSGGSTGLVGAGANAGGIRDEASRLIDGELRKRGKSAQADRTTRKNGGRMSRLDRDGIVELVPKLTISLRQRAIHVILKSSADNCGTGDGGFQPGNACGGEGGGGGGSDDAGAKPSSNESSAGDSSHYATETLFPGMKPEPTMHDGVADKASLYALAAKVKPQFDNAMNHGEGVDVAIGGTAVEVSTADAFLKALDTEGPVIIIAPIKGEKRATEKVQNKYGGDWSRLVDVVRGTVAVDSPKDIPVAANAIRAEMRENGFKLVDVDNRMARPLASGYRDISTKWKSESGMVVELQINTKSMIRTKEGEGHRLYEAYRAIMENKSATEAERGHALGLETTMKSLYEKAWGA